MLGKATSGGRRRAPVTSCTTARGVFDEERKFDGAAERQAKASCAGVECRSSCAPRALEPRSGVREGPLCRLGGSSQASVGTRQQAAGDLALDGPETPQASQGVSLRSEPRSSCCRAKRRPAASRRHGPHASAAGLRSHRPSRSLDAPQYSPGVQEEDRPGIRKAHAPRRPPEERCAQLVLQLTDLAAHGGLGDVQLPGSAADVTLFGDSNEILDLGKAHLPQRNPRRPSRHLRCVRGPSPSLWKNGSRNLRLENRKTPRRTMKKPNRCAGVLAPSSAKLLIAAVVLVACGRSSCSAKQKPEGFTCQRKAVKLKNGVEFETYGARVCERHPIDEKSYGPSFTTPTAYCFTASKVVEAVDERHRAVFTWGAATEERCSPTPFECAGDHDWLGRRGMGPAPIKTDCHKEGP